MRNIDNAAKNRIINKTFCIYVVCLLSGILYSVTQNAILGTITTLGVCFAALKLPVEDCFLLVFGLQFIRVVIPLRIGAAAYGFVLPLYMVLTLKFILERRKVSIEQLLVLLILITDIVVSALSGIVKIGDNINWTFSFIYVIYIIKNYANKIDFEKMFVYFLLAQWTICLINVLAEIRIFGQSLVPDMYGVATTQLGPFAFGKAYESIAGGNGISFNNSLAICMCVIMFPKSRNMIQKIFYAVSIVFLGYCGIFVIGRGFYIEILLFLALILLTSVRKPNQLVIYLLILGLIITFVYFYAYDNIIVNLERVFDRFEDGYGIRGDLVQFAQQLLSSNLQVALVGAGSYYPILYLFTAHNLYLDSLVSLGLLFGIVYWGIIVSLVFVSVKKYSKFAIAPLIPAIMLFVYKYVSGSTRDVGFYYYIAFIIVYAIYHTNQERKNEKNYSNNADI